MAQDLTGQVVKADAYSFAVGEHADIWRGMMMSPSNGRSEGILVAVKVLRGPVDQTMWQNIVREVRVWKTINHPNIAPFLGFSLDFNGSQTPCLISPYYRLGNIMGYLMGRQNVDILSLMTQISGALSYLHGRYIIHGNIKGSNILIGDNYEALLTDFRHSRVILEPSFTASEVVQSDLAPKQTYAEDVFYLTTEALRWMAPELMSAEEDFIPSITPATDVWAFSMAITEIYSQRIPLSHIKVDASVILFVVSGGHPKRENCGQINDDVWQILKMCWSPDPNQRPSMANLYHFFSARSTSLGAERARL